jgi:hypothetical protein
MFDNETLEDTVRDRAVRQPRPSRREPPRRAAAKPMTLPENPIRLKTDGRHFFFAPSIWST